MKEKENKQASDIVKNVNGQLKPQALTLARAVLAMQAKIEQQIPEYENMALAQQVTVGTGETVLRQNPAIQEFRATVRDYSQALNNLTNMIKDAPQEAKTSDLSSIRNMIKVAK